MYEMEKDRGADEDVTTIPINQLLMKIRERVVALAKIVQHKIFILKTIQSDLVSIKQTPLAIVVIVHRALDYAVKTSDAL